MALPDLSVILVAHKLIVSFTFCNFTVTQLMFHCTICTLPPPQIDDSVASLVIAQLLFLQSESNNKPIHMYINSPGEREQAKFFPSSRNVASFHEMSPLILFHCNSFSLAGGVVTAGLAIYDTMQYILNPISTWCVGQAASMGSLLLAAGTSGMRHSLPNARIMVHQPSGGARVRT